MQRAVQCSDLRMPASHVMESFPTRASQLIFQSGPQNRMQILRDAFVLAKNGFHRSSCREHLSQRGPFFFDLEWGQLEFLTPSPGRH